ncbi:MAG: hypothetical protein RDU20_09595 [Desulfomonilaceae bacterium]|nr:hypothetical protein [Desulfomonilaceae bacterium]
MPAEPPLPRMRSCWPVCVLPVAGILIYIASVLAADGFTIDDAYISARYAKNLAFSGQLTWNVGEVPRTEGYTSPLWVVASSLLFFVTDSSAFRPIQLMSAVFGALTLLMPCALARRLGLSRNAVAFPLLFLSLTLPFVVWSASGMENALYTFLVLLALYLVINEEDNGLRYDTPLVLFLVFLTRTEGLVFYGATVAVRCVKLILAPDAGRDQRKRFLVWNAIFLSCLFAYLVWKIYYYEALLPLPVHVKKPAGYAGLAYVGSWLLYVAPFLLLALLGLRIGWNVKKAHMWAALGAYLMAISISNPMMGHDYRLLVTAFPLIYVLAAWELDRLFRNGHAKRAQGMLLVGIVVFLCGTLIKHPGDYVDSLRRRAAASAQVLGQVHIPLGKWLDARREQAGIKRVALADAGAIAFHFEGEIIDLYGLNDREIAHKGFSAQRVLERSPDYIVLNSKSDTRFEGNDTACGKMSEEIFASDSFKKHYSFVKQFVSHEPFYSLWVYQRLQGPER